MKKQESNHDELIIFVFGLIIGLFMGLLIEGPIVSVAVGGRGGDYVDNRKVDNCGIKESK